MTSSRAKKRPSEKELIESISRMVSARDSDSRNVVVGIGDDAAVIRSGAAQKLILTTDIQVENIHFKRKWFTGHELGWRLAAVNLSDIAAMGGKPAYALLSLAVPGDVSTDYVKAIESGAARHLTRYGAEIIGGNISRSEKHLVCDLTLTGSCAAKKIWRRSCRPGRDAIVVVGKLGSARAGLALLEKPRVKKQYPALVRAYKKPRPLVDVALILRNELAVNGAIDVSDGFSTDLIRICEKSEAGCEVNAMEFPVERSLVRFCKDRGEDPVDWALHGGEDYALILSVAANRSQALAMRIQTKLGLPARVVGRFTKRKGCYELLREAGEREEFTSEGWDHFAG
jgi:thiamine-monophosphate kinase